MPNNLRIDLSLPSPAYRQVADGLRAMLVSGAFEIGTRLPPVRQVAADLKLHHNTVAQAYRALADQGWLNLTRGRGATVLRRTTPPHPGRQAATSWRQRLDGLVAEGLAAGLSRANLADAMTAAVARLG